jgi:hypothetical protein
VLPAGQTFNGTGANLTATGATATVRPTEGAHRGIPTGETRDVSWFNADTPIGSTAQPTVSCSGGSTPTTTLPATTLPPTTLPPTTNPGTTLPPTTKPTTTLPPTTKPGSTLPPTTKPGTTLPPTTKPSVGACQATATVTSKFYGGYSLAVSVTNKSVNSLNGWTVVVSLPAGTKIANASNQLTSGTTFVATNPYDKGLLPNETRSLIWINVDSGTSTAAPSVTATCS